MIKQKIAKISLSGLLMLGILIITACSGNQYKVIAVGDVAPAFTLKNLESQSVSLNQFSGKFVLINFWETTCGPCVDEMPYFQELFNGWSMSGEAVFLTVDLGEPPDTVKNFIQGHNYNFPVLLDSQYDVGQKYGIRYTPTTILIDKEGRLKFILIGAFKNKAAIDKQLAAYLSE
jgi:peroxiredoxin